MRYRAILSRITRCCLLAPTIALFLICLMGGNSDQLEVTEAQIKAVFLYNFASFIRIPTHAFSTKNAPMEYCVAGDRQMAEILEAVVKGEIVQGHRLSARFINNPDQIPSCHVLYIGVQDGPTVSRYLQMAAKQDTLTVGDDESFMKRGGMISLRREGRRIRPMINMAAVQRSQINISAKLLSLATLTGMQDD